MPSMRVPLFLQCRQTIHSAMDGNISQMRPQPPQPLYTDDQFRYLQPICLAARSASFPSSAQANGLAWLGLAWLWRPTLMSLDCQINEVLIPSASHQPTSVGALLAYR